VDNKIVSPNRSHFVALGCNEKISRNVISKLKSPLREIGMLVCMVGSCYLWLLKPDDQETVANNQVAILAPDL